MPLFAALENKDIRRRVLYGLIFGGIFYAVLTHWFYIYNPCGYVFFVGMLTLQPILFAIVYKTNFKTKIFNYTYLPLAWVLSEGLRTVFFMGSAGNVFQTQSFHLPVLQSVSLAGSSGLSFLIIFVNNCVYQSIKNKKERKMALSLVAVILIVIYSFGFYRLKKAQTGTSSQRINLKILTIQPNIDPRLKIDDKRVDDIVVKQVNMTKQSLLSYRPDMIVWPETSVPVDFFSDMKIDKAVKSVVRNSGTNFLLGAALIREGDLYNSAVLLNDQGEQKGIYHKRFLIPFSEYLPAGVFWGKLKNWFNIDNYDFSKGGQVEPFLLRLPKEQKGEVQLRFGVLICSEDTIGKTFREYRKSDVDFVVVLLNDAWFKNDLSLTLHAQNAIIHAVENGYPVVRVANSGWSCMIDPYGRISPRERKLSEEASFQHTLVFD